MTNQEYQKYAENKIPPSPLFRDMFRAFWTGGTICVIGQLFMNGYLALGFDKDNASSGTSVTLICIAALLTGFGIYDKIAKYAGAGTIIPITGFSNAVVSPAMEFKSEGMVLGLSVKMFTVAGPVLVYGIVSSVIYGFLYWLMQFFFS